MKQFQISRDRVAAIGDSSSDIPMLELAGLRFFVGANPPQILDVIHLPNSDIRLIAQKILASWR
jgi:phosphoserine phosphatase